MESSDKVLYEVLQNALVPRTKKGTKAQDTDPEKFAKAIVKLWNDCPDAAESFLKMALCKVEESIEGLSRAWELVITLSAPFLPNEERAKLLLLSVTANNKAFPIFEKLLEIFKNVLNTTEESEATSDDDTD